MNIEYTHTHSTHEHLSEKKHADEQYILQINMSFLNYSLTIWEMYMRIYVDVCALCFVHVRNAVVHCIVCLCHWLENDKGHFSSY